MCVEVGRAVGRRETESGGNCELVKDVYNYISLGDYIEEFIY